MTYTPKKSQNINAYEFVGELTEELKSLGIRELPPNQMGSCSCGKPLNEHVMINGNLICPNYYIIYEGGQVVNIMSNSNFESLYKPLYNTDKVIDVEIVEVDIQ